MKKNTLKITFIAFFGLLLTSFSVSAQDREGWRLSVGPEVALPLGDFGDAFDWSIGGSVQAEYPILSNDLYVTLNAGFNNYFGKEEGGFSVEDLQLIPVKAGLKYFVANNLYLQAEAGATFLANKDDIGATKSTTFVYAPQVGYLIPIGGKHYIDAGVRFEGNTKFTDGGATNNLLGLRIAYSFGL